MSTNVQQGKIVECRHCRGSGFCQAERAFWTIRLACANCISRAGLEQGGYYTKVICSVCGGKGEYWIGPGEAPNRN